MNNLPGVYSIDIQQGNRVSQEMINQLKPRMNKRQVRYIMGSPMLIDVFHKKRWDYLYSNQPGGELREQTRISLYFEGDILVGVQGDFKPTANTKIISKEVTVEVPKRELEKTMSEKIKGLFNTGTHENEIETTEPSINEIIEKKQAIEESTD
ncbi:MAG: outer membrane protein assembly factor BamE [Methylococcales bacterium]|nr:outer membrane protein assembly factor BamE [Methylococcales bacterium]